MSKLKVKDMREALTSKVFNQWKQNLKMYRNFTPSQMIGDHSKPSSVLRCSFVWMHSPQGVGYWYNAYERLRYLEASKGWCYV